MTDSIYKEYKNKYYNPDDNDKKPGENDNWKSIQEGFHRIGTTQLETSEGLTLGKGGENEESLSPVELKHIKTALENIPDDYQDLIDDVDDLKSQIDERTELIEELQENVLQKKETILTTKKTSFYVPAGATLVIESDLATGFSRANTINFFDEIGTNIGYKTIVAGGKTASYKVDEDIYAAQVYYDMESITAYYVTQNLGLIQKVNDLYRYPAASGIKSKNLFTAWEIGGLSYTTGVELKTTDQIRSKGYIEVEPSTTYTASDPDRISANARNAQYAIEYDTNFQYVGYSAISTNQTFTTKESTKYIKFASQYVGTGQYVIGDYASFKTMIYKGTEVIPDVSPYPVADRIDEANTA